MSQSGNSPIQFDCRFDPPVVPVGSDYSSILCAFTITAAQCAKLALQNCHLRGVHVGTPPQDFISQLAEAGLQELVFIDDPGRAEEDTEEIGHADSVCDALSWCEDWGRSHDGEPAHFIIFAHEQTLERAREHRVGELGRGPDVVPLHRHGREQEIERTARGDGRWSRCAHGHGVSLHPRGGCDRS